MDVADTLAAVTRELAVIRSLLFAIFMLTAAIMIGVSSRPKRED